MAVRIEANAEPLPGYRLIERLGGGGFGEVWKAEAPGGLFKAIKFVFGDLQTANEDDNRAEQELKGLSRVKSVHHPYILSLERYDIIDGQLFIVMELADRTLWDRFKESRSQGCIGIPREELLQYMAETAEALDLMNGQFQLQHLDIKPQNLFLVYNHVKVADFGLVKDLEGMTGATVTGGITPVYAAPETFDGRISRFSDQYSLAIVYQELLTGTRPFTGSTVRQLVLQHLQGSPDLTPLPARDRPIVLRALSKDPDKRFPTCSEFVQALRAGDKPSATVAPAAKQAAVAARSPLPVPEENLEKTQGVPVKSKLVAPASEPVTGDSSLCGSTAIRGAPVSQFSQRKTVSNHPHDEPSSAGVLQPALVIGLGQLGIDTLRHLRQHLSEEFGGPDALPHLRMLALDVDVEAVQAAMQGEPSSALRNQEVMHTSLHRPSHYLKSREKEGKLAFEDWLNTKMLYRIPRQQTQAGARALGRLAFVDHYRAIYRRFEAELQACCSDDTLHELSQHTELGLRTRVPRVYIVTCLAGTTGGGMFIDAAYVVRELLRRQGYNAAEVVGILYLPPGNRNLVSPLVLANTYAALKELRHYASGQHMFRAQYEKPGARSRAFTEAGPPFQRCYLLKMPERRPGAQISHENASEVVSQAGQFLYRELCTVLGKTADEKRKPFQIELGTSFQSFGVYCLSWPRRQIMDSAARRLCIRLVERWMTKNPAGLIDEIKARTEQEWEVNGLDSETILTREKELCEKVLKHTPESAIANTLAPLVPLLSTPAPPPGKNQTPEPLNLAPVVQALEQLEKLLGVPDTCKTPKNQTQEPGTVEKALGEAAAILGDECERKLAILIVRLIEEPKFRLAGAEEALRQFVAMVEKKLQIYEQLVKDLNEHAALIHQRIQIYLEEPLATATPANTVWKVSFSRRPQQNATSPGQELLELLRAYPKVRYQSLVLTHLSRLYLSLRGQLSDQIREVGFCRQRLGELAGLLEARKSPSESPAAKTLARGARTVLPTGCVDVEDAIKKLEEQITLDHLVEFDGIVQNVLQQQFQALVHVCMGPPQMVRNLVPVMIQEAKNFLDPLLKGDNVGDMFVARHDDSAGGELGLRKEITDIFNQATPEVSVNVECQTCIVSVPPGEAGSRLQKAVQAILPRAHVHESERCDEILFFREESQILIEDLEQFGAAAEEAYQSRLASMPLHTREDIPEWQSGAVPQS